MASEEVSEQKKVQNGSKEKKNQMQILIENLAS